MKNVYDSLRHQPGATNYGLVSIKVAPREWLTADPIIDFNTGKVLTPVALVAGRDWMTLEFTQVSYEYNEKPKSNKSGSYYEISLAGTLNNVPADAQQVIETLRYHQVVAILKDREKRMKIVGTRQAALTVSPANKVQNTQSGQKIFSLDLLMECEDLPPFYEI